MQKYVLLLLFLIVVVSSLNAVVSITSERFWSKYGVDATKGDGYSVDDVFLLQVQTGDGWNRSIGFGRLTKVSYSKGESVFTQHTGDAAMTGMRLDPISTIGLDARFRLGYASYDFVDTVVPFLFYEFELAYNLAPLIGLSQLYIEAEFDFAQAKHPNTVMDPKSLQYVETYRKIQGLYAGLGKKFWLQRHGLHLSAKVGTIDDFYERGGKYDPIETGIAYKFGVGYNLIITRYIMFTAGAEMKTGEFSDIIFNLGGLTLSF
jgi:hypothetical protein